MTLKKGMFLGLGLAGTLLALPSWALDVGALRQAYESGRAQQAYDLALIDLEEGEGDPAFDFYYGVAAIDSGHLNEGVFALERVLLVQPGHLRARLELARGYFLLREDSRAQQEFKAVLAQNPSENVRANVQRFMDAIRLREGRYRPTSSAFVEAGFGHDTNVSSSTEGDVVLFNTGWMHMLDKDPERFGKGEPGLGIDGAKYLVEKEVVAVGGDSWGVEVIPTEDPEILYHVHQILINYNGIYLLENMDTRGLAADNAYEFMFVLGAARMTGAVQMIINPIAIR